MERGNMAQATELPLHVIAKEKATELPLNLIAKEKATELPLNVIAHNSKVLIKH